jgi:hypothetical protein
MVLLHADAPIAFAVSRLAHHQASSLIFTHLEIIVVLSDTLLEGCRCNTLDSFLVRYLMSCTVMNYLYNKLLGWYVTARSLIGERFFEWFGNRSCSITSSSSLSPGIHIVPTLNASRSDIPYSVCQSFDFTDIK